jgi:hypothetical protein
MKNLNEKNYNEVLTEANDYFLAQGISIIGEGYKEVATNTALFESYVDQLTEGCSADDAATMAQLMANTNANILRESSMTGIQPVASLSMPVIRKLWPKFALKDAIETEVAKTPRFVVSYTKPYLFKGDGERIDLVKGLGAYTAKPNGADQELPGALKKEYTAEVSEVLGAGSAVAHTFDTTVAGSPSAAKKQPLDELIITEVEFGGSVEANAYVSASPKKVAKLGKRLGIMGSQVYDIAEGVQLLVQFDGKAGKVTLAAIGGALKVSFKCGISSEYNETSWSVGFDIARQDVDIPTGQHLNAPLPIEALNDMMALYQIDGTKETVDLMTNVFSMKLDLEILDFLRDSLANRPSNEAFFEGYGKVGDFVVAFDCKPAAGFAGSPKAWREEIKPLIDHLAQRIKNETYLQAGQFTIVANPLDVQILANVDWTFRSGAAVSGVDVDYSVGTYAGANAYKVIASTNVPAGAMYLVFCPTGGTQMTYKYYPYTFSTEMGYVDPNRSRVPSLMMTKRHTMHEFMPAIGAIVISNNNGAWFNAWATSGSHYE